MTLTDQITPIQEFTPTPTESEYPTPTEEEGSVIERNIELSPTPTPKITETSQETPTPTPTQTPTETPVPRPGLTHTVGEQGTGQGDGRSSGGGEVLGASSMASTGMFTDTVMNLLATLGISLMGFATVRYAQENQ